MNREGIFICHVCVQGNYLVFIPNKSVLAEKLVEGAHLQTIHEGLVLTMTKVKDQYWIPTPRQLLRRIIEKCYGWKKSNISHYPKPSQGLIPTDRTKQDLSFSVIGTDYTGSFICKTKGKRDIKVYLLLLTCSHTRAVHLDQFPYPLELSCDTWKRQSTVHQCCKQPLNVNANEFKLWRNAAAIAEVQIQDAAEANKDEMWSSSFDLFCQIWGE